MKNLKTAIKHFINGPFNDKWQDKERFLNCFLAEKRALIDFIYVKKENDTKKVLMVALTHPFAKKEFQLDSNMNMLKKTLKIYQNIHPDSIFEGVDEIKFFVSKKIKIMKKRREKIVKNFRAPVYVEKSKGKFKNNAINPELHTLFENLRKKIIADR